MPSNKLYISVFMLILVIWFLQPKKIEIPASAWQEDYQRRIKGLDMDEYIVENDIYDYSNPEIQQVIVDLAEDSNSYQSYVDKVSNYVWDNIQYDFSSTEYDCMTTSGSNSLFVTKRGDCDIQGISIITLLRGKSIASRPVGGCISKRPDCPPTLALYPEPEPIFHPLAVGMITGNRRGGLHLWVEWYDPKMKEWRIIEPTTGKEANEACYNYFVELYPSNIDKLHICQSTNRTFIEECRLR